MLGKNYRGNAIPFGLDVGRRNRGSTGADKPVVGVAGVSFDKVEQGMQPGTGAGFNVLCNVVRFFPPAGFDQPEGLRFQGQARGRHGVS